MWHRLFAAVALVGVLSTSTALWCQYACAVASRGSMSCCPEAGLAPSESAVIASTHDCMRHNGAGTIVPAETRLQNQPLLTVERVRLGASDALPRLRLPLSSTDDTPSGFRQLPVLRI